MLRHGIQRIKEIFLHPNQGYKKIDKHCQSELANLAQS